MIIDDSDCICDKCMKDNRCSIQRIVISLQRIASVLEPKDAWIAIYMKKCPNQVMKE